jgi:succinate-semialdehyde dehydrogenase/glutarate-semialdehyde dehydrogenase
MARTDLAQELYDQVDKSIQKGASLAYGELGDRPQNAHFSPLILTDVKPGMPAYDEELFGPVATVMIAENTKEAIRLANDSPFGLGGSVWTADEAKGIDVARKVQCGAVYVNKMMASDSHVPFGGVKISGYGRELSHLGIREFVNQKTIWVD